MKSASNSFSRKVAAAVFSIAIVAVLVADGKPAAKTASTDSTNITRSVFTLPANPSEGRDPFFPDSLRPYHHAVAAPKLANVSMLTIQGFSGRVNQRFVIINNHTFGPGDEGDVTTSAGRLHLRCVEIRTNSVVIEVGGQRHELFYTNQQ